MPRNISTKTTAERLAGLLNTYYAKKTDLPTKVSDLTNDSEFQTLTQVSDAISAAVSGALQPAGSVAFASLPALAKANCNKIYNITDAFTTTVDFVEGAGKSYPAGTNVAIINTGTASSPVYKYDCYTGTFDFSGFATKVSGGTTGNFAGLDANGNIVDSGSKASDFLTAHQDISGKADKDTDAVAGHVAEFDANGNPVDSGHTLSEYVTDISGKADKVSGAVNGNLAKLDSNGNLVDSGVAASAVITDVSGKADKDTNATAGNIAKFDASGNPVDAGIAYGDIVVASDIVDYTDAELRTLLGLPAAE